MIAAAISLALALVCILAVPPLLSRATWTVHRPKLALALWFAAFFTGCALILNALFALVLPSLDTASISTVSESLIVTAAAWGSLAIIGGVIAIVAQVDEPLQHAQDRERIDLADAALNLEKRPGFTLVLVASDSLFACAVPGRSAQIMYSTALEALLSPPELQAVVAHEYAHLRGSHPRLMRVASVAARLLPRWLPAGREFKRATALLIELIADDTAGKQAGAANLANALVKMGDATGDASLEARAIRLTLRVWPLGRKRHLPEPIRLRQSANPS